MLQLDSLLGLNGKLWKVLHGPVPASHIYDGPAMPVRYA